MDFVDEDKYSSGVGIYRIRNIVNDKVYIGQTVERFVERFWLHRWQLRMGCHVNRHLQNAWNKYGEDAFVFEVVCEVTDTSTIDDLERRYIAEAKKSGLTYNIQGGGQDRGLSDVVISPEVRKRVGAINRERMLGTKLSDETRAKMRRSSKHLSPTEEHRRILSEYMSNRVVAESTKKKLSDMYDGEKSLTAKLNNEQVVEIKKALMDGALLKDLSARYNVSMGAIGHIIRNNGWRGAFVEGWDEYVAERKIRNAKTK